MKSICLIFVYSLIASVSFTQNTEVWMGANYNKYFESGDKDSHVLTANKPGFGYCLGVTFKSCQENWSPMRFSVFIDNYRGTIDNGFYGLGGSTSIYAEVEKTTFGVGFLPVNFKILKRVDLSLGGEARIRIYDRTSGYKAWRIGPDSFSKNLTDYPYSIHKGFFFGVCGKIGYDFLMPANWTLSPQYKFYYGLTEEFKNTDFNTKSLRHYILIGMYRTLTNNG